MRQHSYLMGLDGGWRLAPAYDLTFSASPGGTHYMAVEGEGWSPTRQHILALGNRHGLSDRAIGDINAMVRSAVSERPRLAAELGATVSGEEICERLAYLDRTVLSARSRQQPRQPGWALLFYDSAPHFARAGWVRQLR